MRSGLKSVLGRALVPVIGLGFALVVMGCGAKKSDPDVVGVAELKYPGALKIVDQGNGTVAGAPGMPVPPLRPAL